MEALLVLDCNRVELANEWEGYYAYDEGVIKCSEDIPAYRERVKLPQGTLALLALLDDSFCVGLKTHFVIDDSAQVFVLVDSFHWFHMNCGCSPPHTMLSEVHEHLLGLGNI